MEINYTMNLAQANTLFDAEAVFMYSADVVPEYRVIELSETTWPHGWILAAAMRAI